MDVKILPNYSEAEEGEIVNDDAEDLYTPLERPHVPSVSESKAAFSESDDDNEFQQSSSDSDSSVKKPKILKIRKKASLTETLPKKKKNYNIWCGEVLTEVLTTSLDGVTVDQCNERSRDIESYNYKLGMVRNDKKFKDNYLEFENKTQKQYLGKRKHDGGHTDEMEKYNPNHFYKNQAPDVSNGRNILSLTVDDNNSEDEIAKDIANKLCEEKEELILRALTILGKKTVISLFEKTKEIEASGGMLVMNGTRRRTPGGIFFYLLKTSETIPHSLINLVLSEDKKTRAKKKKIAAKQMRDIQAAKFKMALSKDDFPTLLSRTELAIKEFKARKQMEDSVEVENPPPSPVTE